MIACPSAVLTVAPREVFLVGPPPVADSVRLLRQIATGPHSGVFVGELVGTGVGASRDLVAVKVFRERTPGDVDTLFRLRDVGRSIARLEHPVLAPPLAVAQIQDQLGLVSPYIDGVDLYDLCEVLWQTQTTMNTRVVCGIIAAVAEALDAALHRIPEGEERPLERLHRDLKPSNIMLDRAGGVRLLDLGVGMTSIAGREARARSLKKGLVRYLSPGRRSGKRGGAPADIYALGIMGLELARGGWLKRSRVRNPEHDRHMAEVVARITDLGFRTQGDELAWRNLFLRMVAHDPDARPTAAEVASVCRSLQDTGTGQDLPGFAVTHVAPWLERVPTEPDLDLPAPVAHLLATSAEAPPSPQVLAHTSEEAEDEQDWIETADGWQHADEALAALEELAAATPSVEEPVEPPPAAHEMDPEPFVEPELTGWSQLPVDDTPPTPVAEPVRNEALVTPVLLLGAVGAVFVATLAGAAGLWWWFG